MPYTYEYPHPAVTVDGVVFGYDEADLKVLLIQRQQPPYKSKWALPGGFVDIDESLEDAVARMADDDEVSVVGYNAHAIGEAFAFSG